MVVVVVVAVAVVVVVVALVVITELLIRNILPSGLVRPFSVQAVGGRETG